MRGKAVYMTFFVLALSLLRSVCRAQENQIVNGEFDAGLNSWQISEGDGFAVEVVHGAELSGPNSLKVDIFDASSQETIMVSQSGLALKQGAPYHLSFAAKGQAHRQIGVLLEEADDEGWAHTWHEWIDLTPKAQTFAFEFIHERRDAENVSLRFVARHPFFPLAGEDENIDVFIDSVSFVQEPPADPNLAHYPLPPDGTVHDATWAVLSWTPGRYAAVHDWYFSENFDDVNDGDDMALLWYHMPSPIALIGFPDFVGRPGLIPGTTYYWRIDEVNDLHPDSPWKGDVWSFAIPPLTAYYPIPEDGATVVDPDVTLGWQAGFGAQRHAVYFGENFDEVDAATGGVEQQGTTYNPGLLELGKTYYWRVDESDGLITRKGTVWSFTTVPLKASNLDPPDCDIHENTWTTLSWSPGRYAASHDFYFGCNFEDVNDGTRDTYFWREHSTRVIVGFPDIPSVDGLIPGTTYYWRIDEVNDLHRDSPWKGDVWSFTIAPRAAYDPVPADGNDLVDPNVTLNWTAGMGARSHTVYFGETFEDVNNATGGLPQGATTYTPGPLELGKTYYWRVDEFDGLITHKGTVWSFTTVPLKASNPDPPDGAVYEGTWAVLSWSAGYHAASHDVYLSESFEDVDNGTGDAFQGNLVSTFHVIGFPTFGPPYGLTPGTTHYWRVDEFDGWFMHKGSVWSFTVLSQP